MNESYDVIHTIGSLDFTTYLYFGILVDGTAVIKGESITTTGPVIVPVSISRPTHISGGGVLGVLGRRNPDATKTLNSDGTWSIKR
jgi:hypothetical protein